MIEWWQIALGVGAPMGGLTGVLVYLIRKYNPRDFIDRATFAEVMKSKQSEIDNANAARAEAMKALADSEAGRAEERTTTRTAVETNRAIDYLFTELLPKRGANSAE